MPIYRNKHNNIRLFYSVRSPLVFADGIAKVTSNVLEMDLIFPRNGTYAPADLFPIIFAFQKPEHARILNPHIFYTIRDWDNMFGNDSLGITWSHDMRGANWSSHDPDFVYTFSPKSFRREDRYWLTSTIGWDSCDLNAFSNHGRGGTFRNDLSLSVLFTIKDSAKKVDLVAATANKTYPKELGTTIKITGQMTLSNGDTCAGVASSTPTPNHCQVKIDSAIAASMSGTVVISVSSWRLQSRNHGVDDKARALLLRRFWKKLIPLGSATRKRIYKMRDRKH